ncbi:MAG: tRNA (adenosine(37)-N6)-dimethylallyltransferase MiaA [Candidatus Omnitrophica bacterium]|nr:tRNA (adenosine(37)-N6)-dimethylallyltransferase MiaA [Candidatus Omnitrophota bacterium]
MSEIIFIVGATATGKSDTAYNLAKKINAQIISADSMLFYKEASIVTSKPPEYMLKEIKHHFVGNISVEDTYSVFDYFTKANKLISSLFEKKITQVICGGSGLYVKALLDGIFKGVGEDAALRKELEEQAQKSGKEYLYEELKKVDPQTAAKAKDLRRIIRALEVYRLTGVPLSQKKKEADGLWGKLPIKIFGLNFKREMLYERINKRVDDMFEAGAVEEVKNLLKLKLSHTAEKIIGIKEISGFLRGEYNIEQAKELMKKNTRNFAKRQLTWFRADKRIKWIEKDDLTSEDVIKCITSHAPRSTF